jgi:hypothetical protein
MLSISNVLHVDGTPLEVVMQQTVEESFVISTTAI